MGWQPGLGGQDGGQGTGPDRDPRLAWFASDGGRDALVPSGLLALAADEVCGPGRRCPGASGDELTGLLRGWAAVESWAASGKLGVIAEMIRRDDAPRRGGGRHGDLPDEWPTSLRHELALALACPVQSAEITVWLAWELAARLPGTGALLGDGTLTVPKARAVAETFWYLSDADAATAEALILGQLAGKTYTQVLRLAEQAALTVDPQLAERRRGQAQKDARVVFFREQPGTAGLSGRDLPPDEALAAMAAVNARAQQYEDSGAFGATRMDALRAYAYLDLLKGTPAETRIACAEARDEAAEAAEALAWADARAARNAAQAAAGHDGKTGHDGKAAAAAGPQATPGSGPGTGTGTGSGAGDNASVGSQPGATAAPAPAGPAGPAGTRASGPAAGRPQDTDTRDDGTGTQPSPRNCPCDRPCGECDGGCPPGDGPDDPAAGRAGDGEGGTNGPARHDGHGEDGGAGEDGEDDGESEPGDGGNGGPGHHDDHGHHDGDDDEPGDDGDSGNGGPGPGGPGTRGPGPVPGASPAGRALQPRPPDLAVPLLTLLGLAERPGEIQGFGLLDPALARDMAAAAAASPRTEVCVTVTSPEGYAVGHGCARPGRPSRPGRSPQTATPPGTPSVGLPARLNLTIPATALTSLTSLDGSAGPWAFTPRTSTGPRAARTCPAATAPGHSPSPAAGTSPCTSTWCPPSAATTATKRPATTPAPGCAT